MTTIVQDVIDILRGCGFEVRDDLGASHPFVVSGTLDSAAILIEKLLEPCGHGAESFHWTKKGMVLDPNGFYVHRRASDDIGTTDA